MRLLPGYSLRGRLTLMTALVSGVALLFALVGFAASNYACQRAAMVAEVEAVAAVLAAHVAPAMAAERREEGGELLASLADRPTIESGWLFDERGRVFAVYGHGGADPFEADVPDWTGHRLSGGYLDVSMPVGDREKPLGTICLRASAHDLYRQFYRAVGVVLAVAVLSLAAAALLAFWLQRAFTEPILHLAAAAQRVAEKQDYSFRVTPHRADEVGTLYRHFNEMLDRFEEGEAALRAEREAIGERERDLARSQQVAHVGSWNWDIVHDAVTWSDEMFRIFGAAPETFPRTMAGLKSLVHPDDVWRLEQSMAGQFAGKPFEPFEHRVLRPDGSTRTVEVLPGRLEQDAQGKPVRVSGVVVDVTERRQAEEELKLNQARFETLYQLSQMIGEPEHAIKDFALNAAVAMTHSEFGYIFFMNDEQDTLTVHNWSKEALAQCTMENKPTVYQVSETGLWGEAVRQRRPIITNDYEAPNPWKKGYPEGHVPVRRHMNIPLVDNGKIVLVAGVGNKEKEYDESDARQLTLIMEGMWRIVERKHVDDALRESEKCLAEAQTLAHLGNWTQNLATGAVDGSTEARRIFGFDPVQPICHQDVVDRIAKEDLAVYMDAFRRIQDRGETEELDFRIERAPGDVRWIHLAAEARKDDEGRVRDLFGTVLDITDRKRAEDEREELIGALEVQNAELERFTYTVSHDLKSPLITIKGYLGLLGEDLAAGATEAVDDDVARMTAAADKMEQLLHELLELSRIGRLANPSQEWPLGDLAREALEMVRGQIDQRGVRVEIAPDLPIVFGDRSRLVEVLQNLIGNAVKYMGDQPDPRVEVGVKSLAGETVYYVRDNGIGIEPRYLEKIFGLFDQLDPSVEGSGIGLALARRIVEVHGGRLWAESEGPGHGSTFCFTLACR